MDGNTPFIEAHAQGVNNKGHIRMHQLDNGVSRVPAVVFIIRVENFEFRGLMIVGLDKAPEGKRAANKIPATITTQFIRGADFKESLQEMIESRLLFFGQVGSEITPQSLDKFVPGFQILMPHAL